MKRSALIAGACGVLAVCGSVRAEDPLEMRMAHVGTIENHAAVLIDVMSDLLEPIERREAAFNELCAIDDCAVLPVVFMSLGDDIEIEFNEETKRAGMHDVRDNMASMWYGTFGGADVDGDGYGERFSPPNCYCGSPGISTNFHLRMKDAGVCYLRFDVWGTIIRNTWEDSVQSDVIQDLYADNVHRIQLRNWIQEVRRLDWTAKTEQVAWSLFMNDDLDWYIWYEMGSGLAKRVDDEGGLQILSTVIERLWDMEYERTHFARTISGTQYWKWMNQLSTDHQNKLIAVVAEDFLGESHIPWMQGPAQQLVIVAGLLRNDAVIPGVEITRDRYDRPRVRELKEDDFVHIHEWLDEHLDEIESQIEVGGTS